jgi:ADP-ribosylglycohydrolase
MGTAVVDRIVACLQGIATGDAVAKQTEGLSRDRIQRWYPDSVRGFEGVPGTVIPRYANNSKHQWCIGETTDDTERTLAVARAILDDRAVSHVGVGREMLRCVKCVHPGVTSLWEFHQAADPARVAVTHDGCGAAIRVAPVGILHGSDSRDALVRDARESSISTHGGSLAIAAAAATAAAVSAAIDGASGERVFELAELAAGEAERRWPGPAAPAFAAALRGVRDDLASLPELSAVAVASRCVPDSPLTIVPLALALATLLHSAEDAILLAANVGGDSDSVASIAGGILGARAPSTVNRDWCRVVEQVNGHDLTGVARALAAMRS